MDDKERILKNYKKYDYLNKDKKHPLVKILVGYIKPEFLFKSEILTPIHLGRAVEKDISKEGKLSEVDLKWLHENCIGDDDFDGSISNVNRRVGFLTGTYWAWKNYEKLGNPEYFGFFGYRRLLQPKCLNNLSRYDFVTQKLKTPNKQKIKERLSIFGSNLYDITLKTVKKFYPQDYKGVAAYFNRISGYNDEIYIMKKELFFAFCDWIFPLLFYMLNLNDKNFDFNRDDVSMMHLLKQAKGETRDIAYIIEYLTGFYILKLTKNKNLKFKSVKGLSFIETKKQEAVQYKRNLLWALRKKIKINNGEIKF